MRLHLLAPLAFLAHAACTGCGGGITVDPPDTGDTGCEPLYVWYADDDGDDFGDPDRTVESCVTVPGHVRDGGDCDDSRADVHPGAIDSCNGVDDDCDGTPDGGYPDTDADGVADCVDEWCEVEVGRAGRVDVLGECEPGEPLTDAWSAAEEWSACGLDLTLATMPAVGHLDDDDGDGVVGSGDVPEVVISTRSGLVALDGATGAELFTARADSALATLCNTAIADVDGDGFGEALAVFGRGGLWGGPGVKGLRVMAVDGNGDILWTSDSEDDGEKWAYTCALTAADLEADGTIEVVTDWGVYDGLTGDKVLDLFDAERESDIAIPVLADLDLDGDQEILLGERVYDHEGTHLWSTEVGVLEYFGGTVTLPAQLDGDPEAEVLALYDTMLTAYDTDGTWLYEAFLSVVNAVVVPPCMADLDGDGELELGVVAYDSITAVELDGTELWSKDRTGGGFEVGCSAADLDGDGAAELMYYRDYEVVIHDGASGDEQFKIQADASRILDWPVPVDVDADGAAELVTTVMDHEAECQGVVVYGHEGAGWAEAGTTWGLLDFAEGKQNDAGSFSSDAWWEETFRARAAPDLFPGAHELRLDLVDACVASCEHGPVRLSWQVSNPGGVAAPATGSLVELWDGDERIASTSVSSLDSGEAMAGVVYELDPRDLSGGELVIRASNLAGGECLADEDEVRWTTPCE